MLQHGRTLKFICQMIKTRHRQILCSSTQVRYLAQVLVCVVCVCLQRFAYLKGSCRSSIPCFPKWLYCRSGPGQSQRPGVHPGLLPGGRGPTTWTLLHCFPQVIGRELAQKVGGQALSDMPPLQADLKTETKRLITRGQVEERLFYEWNSSLARLKKKLLIQLRKYKYF